ncbi:MAG: hypothetical protein WA110_04340 [Anaerolineaceae bacterium]
MALPTDRIADDRWQDIRITPDDLQSLSSHLFETEVPLTIDGLAQVLIKTRLEHVLADMKAKQENLGKVYFPKDKYLPGDQIAFPQFSWAAGQVLSSKAGVNPEVGNFSVITVQFEDGSQHQFASEVEDHPLNRANYQANLNETEYTDSVMRAYGPEIRSKLRSALDKQTDLVRIGSTWFPKSLLIDIGQGHLNLAEALLDAQEGGPMGTLDLLSQLELNIDNPENQKLMEFSLNYALQEDPRFEEVGTTGVISWFLKRLEPMSVLEIPLYLRLSPAAEIPSDIPEATEKMIAGLNDEFGFVESDSMPENRITETSVVLNFPHWRTGSLPLTPLTRQVVPSALETEHVKISLLDELSGESISAWVVRPHHYVYGLRDWYLEQNLIPGSIIELTATNDPGVIKIKPQKKRSNKEWIKTVLVGADGGLVIALLRQSIYAGFHDRMAIAIPDVNAIDALWTERQSKTINLKTDVYRMMAELSKLNNQRHVHFIDLYAALNVIRRTSPYGLLNVLNNNADFIYVGDHYYHLSEQG